MIYIHKCALVPHKHQIFPMQLHPLVAGQLLETNIFFSTVSIRGGNQMAISKQMNNLVYDCPIMHHQQRYSAIIPPSRISRTNKTCSTARVYTEVSLTLIS